MTTDERLQALERELSRVRRRHRALLTGAAICLAVALVAWALGPSEADARPRRGGSREVNANGFFLEDPRGNRRGSLIVAGDGTALALSDATGQPRVMLGVDVGGGRRGAMVGLIDATGQPRASVVVHNNRARSVLHDKAGNTRVVVGVEKGQEGIKLYDKNGKLTWSAP